MSSPFLDVRAVLDEAEKRVSARLVALEQENAHLTKENAELWSREHARQDAEARAKTEPPQAEEDRQG